MKKYVSVIFLMGLALLLMLSGCQNSGDNGGDTTPSVTPPDPITLFADGSSEFTIVRAENASNSIVQIAVSLRKAFLDQANIELPLCDEFMYSMSGGTVAIVVGETEDEVSKRLKSTLQYDDFVIHAENGNLYLIGGCESATVEAVNYFIETYLTEVGASLVLEGDLNLKYEHEYALTDLTIAGTPISSYRIVYDNSLYYSKARANDLRNLIIRYSGVMLDVVPDTAEATEHEILVGVTLRSESQQLASSFEAPNVFYKVAMSGNKLAVVNQGVRTGEAALEALENFFKTLTPDACDIHSSNLNISGDVKTSTDKNALSRPAGTDLRVMHSNVLIATGGDNDNGYTDQQRAELLADTYLIYYPDVITFNEMIAGRNINAMIRSLLSKYYTFTNAGYLALFADPDSMDNNLRDRNYATPIAYRKDSGLKEIKSGFNYLSDMISYHGVAWTVFETAEGNRFLAASAHFSENKDADGKWITNFAEDTVKIINVARKEFGDLPVVANGDWFFWMNTAPYNYMIDSGFKDASEVAVKKHSVGIGTYHTIGIGTTDRVEEDICFINTGWFTALAHKNLVDFYTVNGSDHYPVLVDLQFNKPATVDDIEPFDDGTGDLNIKDEGTGGSGEWGTSALPKEN